ncbi:MAG: chemotaxis protein CheA [Desulfuromonadales bacterium]
MASDSSLIIQFIAETRDNLEDAARGLLALENSAADQELISSIFRSFHTIKGTSGIFPEFKAITSLTHVAEDLMDQVRNGQMNLIGEHVDLFLNTLDLVSVWLDSIEATGAVPPDATQASTPLRERFLVYLNRQQEQSAPPPVAAVAQDAPALTALRHWLPTIPEQYKQEFTQSIASGEQLCVIRYAPDENSFFYGDDPINLLRQLQDMRLLEITTGAPPEPADVYDPFVCKLTFLAVVGDSRESLATLFAYVEEQMCLLELQPEYLDRRKPRTQTAASGTATAPFQTSAEAEPDQTQPPGPPADLTHKKSASATVLRIDQSLITRFVDLVGEIIIAKNTLPYLSRRAADYYELPPLGEEIFNAYDSINHIVENLQDIALEMRMLPVAKAFERFPRLVRDISAKLGKKILLVMEGEETKADKDVIEALSEPMVHMVRNSLDHGLEPPEERVAAGKTPEGTIRLKAYQDNSGIVVEIHDDGRGIDPDRIRKKAAEKGIATPEALAAMADDAVIQLIMAPNFSTAETISDLSGRGVGMDVVNSMVQGFGGSVKIFSTKGIGSRVCLTLPLSMAIAKLLIVKQGDSTLGIPSSDIVETLIDLPRSRVTTLATAPGLEVRGNLLPLYRLSIQLAMENAACVELDNFAAVVLNVRGEMVALQVDTFCDIIDVVVKLLEGFMSGNRFYSGSTILGDGTIMFVLNLTEVISYAG